MAHRGRGPSSFPSAPSDDMGSSSMSFEVVAIGTKNSRLFFFCRSSAIFDDESEGVGLPFFFWCFFFVDFHFVLRRPADLIPSPTNTRNVHEPMENSVLEQQKFQRTLGRTTKVESMADTIDRKKSEETPLGFLLSLSLSLSLSLFIFFSLSLLHPRPRSTSDSGPLGRTAAIRRPQYETR